MKELFHFLQYHNAVPVALGVLFLGAGATFAVANPEAIYSTQEQIVSIDNTYLVDKNLSEWSPQIRINAVTEDERYYYVDYSLTTIDLDAYQWRDLVKQLRMDVSKEDLGRYRDLGVYVTQQLGQIIDRERQRLAQTQEIERRQVSLAVVATTYGGLVGKFLNDTTDTLPGYTPVVTALADSPGGTFSAPATSTGAGGLSGGAGGTPIAQVGLQVLGKNPARVAIGVSYVDLGVALIDPLKTNVGVHTFLDGTEVVTPSIDTSTSTSYAIEYRVTDLGGITVIARRIILVGDAEDPGGEIHEAGNVTPAAPPALSGESTAPLSPPEAAPENGAEDATGSTTASSTPESAPATTTSATTTAGTSEPSEPEGDTAEVASTETVATTTEESAPQEEATTPPTDTASSTPEA